MGLKAFTITLLLTFFFTSCKKGSGPLPGKTASQLLTESNWKLVEAYSNTEKDGVYATKDLYVDLKDCEKDNLLIFDKESNVTLDEGGEKCNEFDPQTRVNQKWVLVSNTQIEFTNIIFENSYEATIIELTETTLYVRVTGTDPDGTHFQNSFKYNKAN